MIPGALDLGGGLGEIPPSLISHPPSPPSQTLKAEMKVSAFSQEPLVVSLPTQHSTWEDLSATSHYVNDFGFFAKSE